MLPHYVRLILHFPPSVLYLSRTRSLLTLAVVPALLNSATCVPFPGRLVTAPDGTKTAGSHTLPKL
jgi:hypothetical protein